MRRPKAARLALALTVALLAHEAPVASAACRVCDPFLHCLEQSPGAKVCVEGPGTCSMLWPCFVGGSRLPDGEGSLTAWTLFEADAPVAASVQSAGPLALGEEARPIGATTGAVTDARLAWGEAFAVAVVDTWGEGFGVRREPVGDGARVQVCEWRSGAGGAVVAEAVLRGHERLVAPVRVDGRAAVLVVQVAPPGAGRDGASLARWRRALGETAERRPARGLELRPM